MATNYPTSIDSPTNPSSGNTLNSPSHSAQHAFENDAIVALETKVGITGSAVNTTLDYKLSGIATGDKAASLTGTESFTNKTLGSGTKITLGSDATGDMYYRNSGGVLTRLPAGTDGQIIQYSGGIPTTVSNPAAADASTVPVKGVVVLATQAKVDTADDTNTTTAKNVITPSTLRARLVNSGVVDTGSSTAYAIAPSPAITSYTTYQEFTWKAVNANTTTTPTLNVNGLGAKTITNQDGTALTIGQITAGSIVTNVYDGTNMQMISKAANLAAPSSYNSTFTQDISLTTTITKAHGLGRIPTFVQLDSYMLSNNVIAFSKGSYNGTTQNTTYGAINSASAAPTLLNLSAKFFHMAKATNPSDSDFLEGVVSVDATNITITLTKTNTPTGTANLMLQAF